MEKIIPQDSGLYSRYLIGRARHLFYLARQKELKPYHISHQQANVLNILYNLGDEATLTEVAWQTNRSFNTISIITTRMENDGLVIKERSTPKSNQLRFKLTEKGLNIYAQVKEMTSVKEIMSVLSEEERQQLISALEKIIIKAENNK